jgi:hypothetical protein
VNLHRHAGLLAGKADGVVRPVHVLTLQVVTQKDIRTGTDIETLSNYKLPYWLRRGKHLRNEALAAEGLIYVAFAVSIGSGGWNCCRSSNQGRRLVFIWAIIWLKLTIRSLAVNGVGWSGSLKVLPKIGRLVNCKREY